MDQQTRKSFIFDYDGVISDSLTVYLKIYNEIYHKYGLPEVKTRADVRKLFDKNITHTLSTQYGLSDDRITSYLTEFKNLSIARKNEFNPFEGIREAITVLAQSGTLSIIIATDTSS